MVRRSCHGAVKKDESVLQFLSAENNRLIDVLEVTSLRSPQEFKALRERGQRRTPSPWLIVYRRKNTQGIIRLGCTLPRYVGNAVVRNRIRRWCREFVRAWARELNEQQAMDISLVFRKMDAGFFKKLQHEELDEILHKGLGKTA